jgi:hypothetical protein
MIEFDHGYSYDERMTLSIYPVKEEQLPDVYDVYAASGRLEYRYIKAFRTLVLTPEEGREEVELDW